MCTLEIVVALSHLFPVLWPSMEKIPAIQSKVMVLSGILHCCPRLCCLQHGPMAVQSLLVCHHLMVHQRTCSRVLQCTLRNHCQVGMTRLLSRLPVFEIQMPDCHRAIWDFEHQVHSVLGVHHLLINHLVLYQFLPVVQSSRPLTWLECQTSSQLLVELHLMHCKARKAMLVSELLVLGVLLDLPCFSHPV